ncbi:MAG TPA: hypothetical protein VJ506_00120 [Candidatus Limnocylindrales bacterium]|nr:hypothetical protein [Candidatus Limnocylindrales bacterium]
MLHFPLLDLMHRHDDGSVARMEEAAHESPASEDPERLWLRGGRLFRCPQCNEEVVVGPPPEPGELETGRP